MTDPNLTAEILTVLTPFLPYLVKGGKLAAKKAFEKLGEQFSETAWESAKALWEKLRRKEKVAQVAETAAALPENEGLRAALAEEIARALREDPKLAEEVAALIPAGTKVIASGNRSVAIGGSVNGSVIITGDGNRVSK